MFITFEAEITPDGLIQLPEQYRNLINRRVSIVITDEPIDIKPSAKKEKNLKFAGLWSDLTNKDVAEMFPRTQLFKVDGVIVDEKENS